MNENYTDFYTDNCPAGKTVGSKTSSGLTRKGIDQEKIITIDNGALRFQPLIQPGWGRQGIAYGPFDRVNGLALAVFLLNGHNTSQAEPIEPLIKRFYLWITGVKTDLPPLRLWRWLRSRYHKKGTLRRLLWWIRLSPLVEKYLLPIERIDENLALGWFTSEIPQNLLKSGNIFVVHATGADNGELWSRIGENMLSAFKGLENVQTYYLIILRERGAAYYGASVPGANGFAAYPQMRPIAIDPFNQDPQVYAGIYQSVLGQIGFRVDTRVYGTQIAIVPELANWFGTAHIADSLLGDALLENHHAEIGGNWIICQGNYQLTDQGAVAMAADSMAIMRSNLTTGLIHCLVETFDRVTEVGIIWRFQDENNYWSWTIDDRGWQLKIKENGNWQSIDRNQDDRLLNKNVNSLQILDEGTRLSLYVNGRLVQVDRLIDTRLVNATGVGITTGATNNNQYIRFFEAHPRQVNIPKVLDLGSPWWKQGTKIVVADDFASDSVRELEGKDTSYGNKIWHREIGKGVFKLTSYNSLKVIATAEKPNPGRTAYTIDWEDTHFADLQVDITPPGSARHQSEGGRGGVIFWQDSKNYLIVNNWLSDAYGGAAVSCFFHLDGFEEAFEAVWTNVGSRIFWGVKHKFRVVFDSMNFIVAIDDEPVTYRALTDVYPNVSPLLINKVGIVANWEWGNDTGSIFENFQCRGNP